MKLGANDGGVTRSQCQAVHPIGGLRTGQVIQIVSGIAGIITVTTSNHMDTVGSSVVKVSLVAWLSIP